jgi:hypothetical protein
MTDFNMDNFVVNQSLWGRGVIYENQFLTSSFKLISSEFEGNFSFTSDLWDQTESVGILSMSETICVNWVDVSSLNHVVTVGKNPN